MVVILLLTNLNEGLSESILSNPIADESKKTKPAGKEGVESDLDTAIGFAMLLEQREEVALGPQPDPVPAAQGSYGSSDEIAEQLRWEAGPLIGPSSRFVDK
jgi:hypothetical protein